MLGSLVLNRNKKVSELLGNSSHFDDFLWATIDLSENIEISIDKLSIGEQGNASSKNESAENFRVEDLFAFSKGWRKDFLWLLSLIFTNADQTTISSWTDLKVLKLAK